MLKYDAIHQLDQDHVLATYRRLPVLMVQGAGCYLWDNRGNRYLDLLAGIAVCQLGHCHPAVVTAITRQAQQLIHVSNLFLTAPQAKLAAKLTALSGLERVFFAVCGATANEAALKIARKHGNRKRPDGDYEIIVLENAFHGRTTGALSLTPKPQYQDSFRPLLPNIRVVPVDDAEALRAAFSERTAAICIEPVQGEGGVRAISGPFLELAQSLCHEHDALLVLDEVQSGIGRTGRWFAFQHYGLTPDVVTLAKGLGGGIPIGAVLVGPRAKLLEPGDHGSTFGGNPLSAATALAVVDTIEQQDLLAHTARVGQWFAEELGNLPGVQEVNGLGLMIGVELDQPNARDVVKAALDRHLIINATSDTRLRFVPPLVVTQEELAVAVGILREILEAGSLSPQPASPKKVAAQVAEAAAPVLNRAGIKDVLSIDDLTDDEIESILASAHADRLRRKTAPALISPIEDRSVAMIFEKPSLRTRVSFETAIRELGGHPIYLTNKDIGLGSREAVKDIASNLTGWCDLIVARMYWHRQIKELAEFAQVPVINALTEYEHPCQALADIMAIQQEFGDEPVPITYVGDGNNVARSLAKLAVRMGYPFTLAGPSNFQLEPIPGVQQTDDLIAGVQGARVIYTDVWISMGDEREQEHRMKVFASYQVNEAVMKHAAEDAIFLHCLPARRGYEVTDGVIDGPHSRVVGQAENRLHVQKALIREVTGL